MNPRSYYRNSTLAFPKTAEYGCAITRYTKRLNPDSVVMYVCTFAVVFLTVLLIVDAMV